MLNTVFVIACLAAGVVLGVLYFGGLWLTVRRVVEGRWSKTMLLMSFAVRAALILIGFYVILQVGGARWEGLALSLLGFMGTRLTLQRTLSPAFPTATTKNVG